MRARIGSSLTLLALLGLFAATPLGAEILRAETGDLTVLSKPSLPTRGEPQQSVLARYGEPLGRYATVGGGSRWQPPITRWDYADFSVIFEGTYALHSVLHGPVTPQSQ
jgi:hypothetical protein